MITAQPVNVGKATGVKSSVAAAATPELLASIDKNRKELVVTTSKDPKTTNNNYVATFKDHKGTEHVIKFKDSQSSTSAAVVNKNGVSYVGVVNHVIPTDYYKTLGMSDGLVKCLEFISKNEGCYDAINSYDKAFFSFGFVQYAGGGRTFHTLLALIKYTNPELFKECYQRFGIDVEYTFDKERFAGQQVVVYCPTAVNGKNILKGEEAEKHLSDNKLLTAVFIRSAYNIEIGKMQILMFTYEFANKALVHQITLPFGKVKTVDIVSTTAVITCLLDMSINQGTSGAGKLFEAGYLAIGTRKGLKTLDDYKKINEKEILNEIIATTPKEIVKKRVTLALTLVGQLA